MRTQQFLITVTVAAGLLCSPLIAVAADGGPPPVPRNEVCKENPGKCDEARAKRQEFCAANPQKCEQQREQMKAKRAEMQARCKADPDKCEQMKQEARKNHQDRMGGPPPSGSNSKPKSAD